MTLYLTIGFLELLQYTTLAIHAGISSEERDLVAKNFNKPHFNVDCLVDCLEDDIDHDTDDCLDNEIVSEVDEELNGKDGKAVIAEEAKPEGPSLTAASRALVWAGEVDVAKSNWDSDYRSSSWFSTYYCFHRDGTTPSNIRKIDSFADSYYLEGGRLCIRHFKTGLSLVCAPESQVLNSLKRAHDYNGHWGKQGTLALLRRHVYWPNQSTNGMGNKP
ncbi:hypothetical protein MGYG_05221 [Nannizzia gypsea CBS 118893]|uniref:Integrase zinc-binding domain-containing protein n=1 Tax=Arthroderma gypseum (strain ATCC MYA-4604 / CBS 118893) TaxID=535722 RepID=E4UV91_ARTGP|nr:hypothetical protein MGYG_05221 [Nannizzia gypsea CBS 118893]EFR02218.1 hypothetical protein MGYG_05221 [Nannizzia gypsea CBS 118893]